MSRVRAAKADKGFFATQRPGGLHEHVYQSLVHAIVSGRFVKASRLPSETDLAMTFAVSRPVVRQALEKMRADGLIESHRGSGNYVNGLDRLLETRMQPIGMWTHYATGMMDDLEFRLIVEPEAACLAARRRGTADLARLRGAMVRFEEAHVAGQITHHFDYLFHEAIALATSNLRFIEAARALEFSKTAESLLLRHLTYFQPVPRGTEFIREHQRVLELIEQREGEAARRAMRDHLEASRNRLGEQLARLNNSAVRPPRDRSGPSGSDDPVLAPGPVVMEGPAGD